MMPKLTPDHELKTLSIYFRPILEGLKTFEVRRDDRGFQKGDILKLNELKESITGRLMLSGNSCLVRVKWILTGGQFGIEPGYVVMAISVVDEDGDAQ